MQKIIAKYLADRSYKNAVALRRYKDKHPMAVCMLYGTDLTTFNEAIAHAEKGEGLTCNTQRSTGIKADGLHLPNTTP